MQFYQQFLTEQPTTLYKNNHRRKPKKGQVKTLAHNRRKTTLIFSKKFQILYQKSYSKTYRKKKPKKCYLTSF